MATSLAQVQANCQANGLNGMAGNPGLDPRLLVRALKLIQMGLKATIDISQFPPYETLPVGFFESAQSRVLSRESAQS